MKKRVLAVLLALCLALALVPMSAFAADSDFSIENGTLLEYTGPGGAVTIPDGVTSISTYAFDGCTDLTSITIPSSVTDLDWCAFDGCTNLTSFQVSTGNPNYASVDGVLFSKDLHALVQCPMGKKGAYTIPNSVTEIWSGAFGGCTGLTGVDIPNSVTMISHGAFQGCTGLTSVSIPDSVTSIQGSLYMYGGAFSGCTNLADVTISNADTDIDGDAFAGTAWMENQGDFAIMNGILLSYRGPGGAVTIPDGVTAIDGDAFFYCENLTSVNIPDTVTRIKDTNVVQPGGAFSCTGLTSVTIPGSVTYIGCFAFCGCPNLTSVTILNGVTDIGMYAFGGCENLTSVTIPGSATEIFRDAFDGTPFLKNMGDFAVVNGILLRYQGSGGHVTIPNGVTRIGDWAFEGHTDLTGVTIPNSVTSIESWAFSGNTSLKDVYYAGSEAQWNAISIGEGNEELTSATIHFNCATATPTNDKLSVDGKDASPAAYKIGGANYFKLRDVAMLLSGTKAQFEISYDNEKKAINISTGRPYTPQGYELQAMPAGSTPAETSGDAVYVNGQKVDLTAYKIGGANFYGIRELAQKLGFNVGWTNGRGMFIESDKPYTDAD